MLTSCPMNRALAAVMFLAATSSVASAGTYLGLGIGTAPAISENTDRLSSDGRSGRFLLGMRFARISVEGSVGDYDVLISPAGTAMPYGTAYQASAALKASFPLGNNFEAFGRGGVQHTWINADDGVHDVSGSGYLLGAGFEYRLNLLLGQGSIFVDYQYNKAKLEGDRLAFDASTRMWTLGLTLGI